MSWPGIVPEHREPLVREAFRTLKLLTPIERGLILCWFCDACCEEIPPGGEHDCRLKEEEEG